VDSAALSRRRFVPLATIGVCVTCFVLAVWARQPHSFAARAVAAWRALPPEGAVSPTAWLRAAFVAFLHVEPSHAISNIALLAWLGSLAERRVGHVTLVVFAIASGMLTTIAELVVTGHGKIGASGIVFAAGALVLATSREAPQLPRRLAVIVGGALAVAFAYGLIVSDRSNPTGIVAHTSGLVFGGAYGVFRQGSVRSLVQTR
jgi:membrane associated rhomboid family serine protease